MTKTKKSSTTTEAEEHSYTVSWTEYLLMINFGVAAAAAEDHCCMQLVKMKNVEGMNYH